MIDVGIIGAGPSGSLAAWELASQGINVTIFERNSQIGVPNHCAGLIAKAGFERIGLHIPSSAVENRVSGAIFHSPHEQLTLNRSKANEMCVVRRDVLDRWLVECGKKQGANYCLNTTIKSISRTNSYWSLKTTAGQLIDTKIVIDAEGSRNTIIRQVLSHGINADWRLPAIQYDFEIHNQLDLQYVELYHGMQWAPGFFAWIIPTSSTTGRVGLALHRRFLSPNNRLSDWLDHFLAHHPIASQKLAQITIVKRRGGEVPAYGPLRHTVAPGFLVVGDAAGHAKATTGGGVNIGGYCGRLAGQVAARAILANDTSNEFLSQYEKRWKQLFWRELYLMTYYRRIVGTLPDPVLDRLLHAAKYSTFGQSLDRISDIDLHFRGLMKAGFTPRVLIAGLQSFPAILSRAALEIL